MKKWILDIKSKTKDMDKRQALEYVAAYYWYHILLAVLGLLLVLLTGYHVIWGRRASQFTCVMVNQQIDSERDQALAGEFAGFAGMKPDSLTVDSNYQISYGEMEFEEVNESSYEKFFFNWSLGELDAVVMPESFYEYCKKQGGEFLDIGNLFPGAGSKEDGPKGAGIPEDAVYRGEEGHYALYASQTALAEFIMEDPGDPVLLVFPTLGKHREAAEKFLDYCLAAVGL